MTKKEALQLFEEKKVRTVWDDEHEKWYFSIVDVVAVLTDSVVASFSTSSVFSTVNNLRLYSAAHGLPLI